MRVEEFTQSVRRAGGSERKISNFHKPLNVVVSGNERLSRLKIYKSIKKKTADV